MKRNPGDRSQEQGSRNKESGIRERMSLAEFAGSAEESERFFILSSDSWILDPVSFFDTDTDTHTVVPPY
jgi:hypothetical protein